MFKSLKTPQLHFSRQTLLYIFKILDGIWDFGSSDMGLPNVKRGKTNNFIEPDKFVTISEYRKLLVSLDDVKAGTPIIKPLFPQLQHECKECQSQVHPKEQ